MSVLGPVAPARGRSAFRTCFPWAVLGLGACAIALLWTWLPPDWPDVWRVLGTQAVILLTSLLLLLWMLFLSYFSWAVRGGILVVVVLAAGVLAAAVREVRFTGNMRPLLVWRWINPSDLALEEHRRAHAVGAPAALELTTLPTDFPEYRGRRRDGVVTGPALARDWGARPPRLLWKQPVGGGYAAFAIAGNLAVTIEQRRGEEALVAYDAVSGGERWSYAYPALFHEIMGGNGPRATPTVADGQVYALGGTGKLVCVDALTGKRRWEVDILEGNDNLSWGMCGAPLVYDAYVVVSPGSQRPGRHTLVAYQRATGHKAWEAGQARGAYSSPMLATLAGVRQILLLDGEGLAGYDAGTGQELWRFPWETNQDINVAQPLVLDGDRVFISSGYGVGCALLEITQRDGKWAVQPVWRKRTMRCKFTSPVARGGHLYGLDEGILVCLDEKTGERQWRDGRYGHGQLLLSGDLLVILAESGELALVEASPAAYRELGRIAVFESKTWNCPALANGNVYVRNDQDMACYDLTLSGGR